MKEIKENQLFSAINNVLEVIIEKNQQLNFINGFTVSFFWNR